MPFEPDVRTYIKQNIDGSAKVIGEVYVPEHNVATPQYWDRALRDELLPALARRIADELYPRVMAQMDLEVLVKEAAAQVGAVIAERVLGGKR